MSSPLRRLVSAAGARLGVLPITAVASLLISRTVSIEYSVDVYAIFILAYTIPALLPSFDFGLGAPVTTAAANIETQGSVFRWVFQRASRILAAIAVGVVALGAVATFLPGWDVLLGFGDPSYNTAFLVATVFIAASIALGLGPALMLGQGKNSLLTILQGISGPLTLGIVFLLAMLGLPPWWTAAFAPAGLFVTNTAIYIVARSDARVRAVSGVAPTRVSVAGVAIPMLIILIATPIAIQSGRVALSWMTDLPTVAAYAAAFTLFGPAYSVGQIAGRSLWPDFVRTRNNPSAQRSLFLRAFAICAGIGIVLAVGFYVTAPFATSLVFPESINISRQTWVWMALSVFVIAVHQPGAMLMTDEVGLRVQAATSLALAVFVLICTVALAGSMHEAAPAFSLAAGFLLIQMVPVTAVAVRRLRAT
ncbi:hypothetical protein [Microbacterium sp. NPDC086615]|uniref:lipopolysaccharide biosynthesis protein n=1 Tax=Microbacterium sp. NPDC086615 TaxID=3154865 RepID=UPI00341D8582